MDFIKRTLPVLLGIFLLSVAVRWPHLNRPLSAHHEFCTAIALRIMQVWDTEGISHVGYNPAMNYARPADKYINNHANQSGKMLDTNGNYYYVSHPPFAYYLPYFVFKLLHIKPDVPALQIFNLSLHFISGLFVYFTVCLLSFNRARSLPYRSALVAYVIYLFLPVTLWFQGNVFMSDMAVHTLFVIGVYTALKMIIRKKFYSPKYIFLYAVVLALMIYTSWMGLFFAAGVLIYSLLHVRDIRGFRVLIYTTLLVSIFVLQLIVYQYAQINGLSAYIQEMLSRYLVRGSVGETDKGLFHFMFSYLWYVKNIVYNYLVNYLIVYLIISLFVWLAISRKKLKIMFSENGYRFIWLCIMPVVLMHIVFLNYSQHDFTALYASLFFSVLLGILYDKVKKSGAIPIMQMRTGLAIAIALMVAEYFFINKNGSDKYLLAGDVIRQNTDTNEVAFLLNDAAEPQLVFYAERNIRQALSAEDAVDFLESVHQSKAVIYQWKNGKLEVAQRFELLH